MCLISLNTGDDMTVFVRSDANLTVFLAARTLLVRYIRSYWNNRRFLFNCSKFAETTGGLFTALFLSALRVFSWLWFNSCRPAVHLSRAWNDRDCTWNTRSRIPRYVRRQEWPVRATLACVFFFILFNSLTQASTFWPTAITEITPICFWLSVRPESVAMRNIFIWFRGFNDACVVFVSVSAWQMHLCPWNAERGTLSVTSSHTRVDLKLLLSRLW